MSKKITAVVMALVMIVCCLFVVSVNGQDNYAVSMNEGRDAIIATFQKGVGPEIAGTAIDYVYYSPVGKITVDKTAEPATDEDGEPVSEKEPDGPVKYPVVFGFQGAGNNKKARFADNRKGLYQLGEQRVSGEIQGHPRCIYCRYACS